MSPSEFTFKLTVPADPEGATVVAAVAKHAVEYANLDRTAGATFVDRVRGLAASALNDGSASQCLVVFAAADGRLTITIGKDSISERLPS